MSDALAHLTLTRLEQNDFASYGHLCDGEGKQLGVTLELPWRENARDVSCVPAGTYTIKRRWSNKHKRELFCLENVPHRSDCEIHVANLPEDLLGCAGLGEAFGHVEKANGHTGYGILKSEAALDHFMALMAGRDDALLTILDPPAVPPASSTAAAAPLH